jgi:hypothetical protein
MDKYNNIPEFFSNYITNIHDTPSPEEWLKSEVLPLLSPNIEFIVDFGCALGRNFAPFLEQYKCIGFDIHSPENVNKYYNFKYFRCSVEDFVLNPNKIGIDWSKSLVMTHGTLMYCESPWPQNLFLKILRDKGCNNFVLHEYASDLLIQTGALSENARQGGLGYLKLDDDNSKLFNPPLGKKINFRDIENDLQAHICLETHTK